MNMENGIFLRCTRHPSQNFTGFCPTCLAERLSSVERRPKRSSFLDEEDVDLSPPISDTQKKPQEIKVRKTLLSLFHQDDKNKLDVGTEENSSRNAIENQHSGNTNVQSSEIECEPEIKASPCEHGTDIINCGIYLDPKSRFSEHRTDPETKASRSCSTTAENSSADTCIVKQLDSAGDDNLKQKVPSSWLDSIISRKVTKWRIARTFRKNSDAVHEREQIQYFGERLPEMKPKFRHSCDWNLFSDSTKTSWEEPRHSCDGSVMGRAFTCSFACLEEIKDPHMRRPSEIWGSNSSISQRRKRNLQDSMLMNSKRPISATVSSRFDSVSTIKLEHLPQQNRTNKPLQDQFLEETCQGIPVRSVSRRITHKWSKVWNWSISSPFRDFNMRKEHVLDRSLSESWREYNQVKTTKNVESDGELRFVGHSLSSSRTTASFNRNRYAGNSDICSRRIDRPKNKQEYRFGRSQSIHYTSPGHLDNGLLRFYLTPLRSSRRNPSRGRAKTPRSFSRGIFGLH